MYEFITEGAVCISKQTLKLCYLINFNDGEHLLSYDEGKEQFANCKDEYQIINERNFLTLKCDMDEKEENIITIYGIETSMYDGA